MLQRLRKLFSPFIFGNTGDRLRDLIPDLSRKRILFIANSRLATLQISFLDPLQPLIDDGQLQCHVLTEEDLKGVFQDAACAAAEAETVAVCDAFRPDIIVFCRYSGPHAEALAAWAKRHGIPIVFHIDDNLLKVPAELGEAKYRFHNHPSRTGAIRLLLNKANLVYCSTPELARQLQPEAESQQFYAGQIYCASDSMRGPRDDACLTFGYMGTDHRSDFEVASKAVGRVLSELPKARFEIFGSTPLPRELQQFSDRIQLHKPVASYSAFRQYLNSLDWAVGLCTLQPTRFNLAKADTKWVEYTAAGMAVVASRGPVYERACADDCGRLADDEAAWFASIRSLLLDASARQALVQNAQIKLADRYSPSGLTAQVLNVLARCGVTMGFREL
jgi:hypothetical protein